MWPVNMGLLDNTGLEETRWKQRSKITGHQRFRYETEMGRIGLYFSTQKENKYKQAPIHGIPERL
jgi:hypothetical protein